MDSIIKTITNSLNFMPAELLIFFISLMPILELRGGLIAASILGVDWRIAFPICVIGNMLPIPFILIFINKIFAFLKKTKFHKMIDALESRAQKKGENLSKYKDLGLFGLVAIPLPGTGGWTGALVAALLRLGTKKSTFIIALGVITAGIIMSLLSYVIPNLI